MGLFSKPEKKTGSKRRSATRTPVSDGSVRCSRCGRRIPSGRKYFRIEGRPYCAKCGESEMDWNFLEMMDILDEI